MHELDTTQLRRQASVSARNSQRNLRLTLFAVHVFLYLAALAVAAVMVVGLPYLFDVFWNSVDASLVVFGLFAGWGIGLLLHGAGVVVDSGWMERQLRQRAAAGVLGRALLDEEADAETLAKAKRLADNEPAFTLTDDGELAPAESEPHGSQA
ncbi:MAG: 2TM domain-containing protein [Anaerolineae bacterium]